MIDINLLPDSKLEKLKKRRSKQLAISISTIVIIVSIGLPTVMFILDFALQRTIISKQESIDALRKEYESKEDVQEILTVQSHLDKILEVEGKTNNMSNLFAFIEFATPGEVQISSISVDSESQTFEIQAGARTIAEANRFIDTIEALQIVKPDTEGETIAPLTLPLTTNFSSDSDDLVSFSVEGTYSSELTEIGKSRKFVLKPYKIEQSSQSGKELGSKE